MKYLAGWLIRLYQKFSRLTPGVCRFYPTCSQYAYTAIMRFGFFRGMWLAIRRIFRCNPWNPGGIDPVPEKETLPVRIRLPFRQDFRNRKD